MRKSHNQYFCTDKFIFYVYLENKSLFFYNKVVSDIFYKYDISQPFLLVIIFFFRLENL